MARKIKVTITTRGKGSETNISTPDISKAKMYTASNGKQLLISDEVAAFVTKMWSENTVIKVEISNKEDRP